MAQFAQCPSKCVGPAFVCHNSDLSCVQCDGCIYQSVLWSALYSLGGWFLIHLVCVASGGVRFAETESGPSVSGFVLYDSAGSANGVTQGKAHQHCVSRVWPLPLVAQVVSRSCYARISPACLEISVMT